MTNPLDAAHEVLESSLLSFNGEPVGTVAARDANAPAANYAECFVRDFVPPALVFLLEGRFDVVRNFLQTILKIRHQQTNMAGHEKLPGVMPASFRVDTDDEGCEQLHADFGDRAIGRVAPVDSMMWWIVLLLAYTRVSGDRQLADSPECQRAVATVMELCLRDGYEVFPTLLVPDGAFMIDRRMGVYGHPLEIQALFYGSLRAAQALLRPDGDYQHLIKLAGQRELVLRAYIRIYYWLDLERLNQIHRFGTEEFGHDSINAHNIYPESIPDWVVDWLPDRAGYLVGNLGPGRIDFRYFAFGNLLAIFFDLTTDEETAGIMHLYEERWNDLVGLMPLKIGYPAMQGSEWRLMTGSDPKNSPWSYHNGGNWPALLWAFAGAAVKSGHAELAQRAIEIAAPRLLQDNWPEYYDGRYGRLIGRRANYWQTWSAASLILAEKFIDKSNACDALGICSI